MTFSESLVNPGATRTRSLPGVSSPGSEIPIPGSLGASGGPEPNSLHVCGRYSTQAMCFGLSFCSQFARKRRVACFYVHHTCGPIIRCPGLSDQGDLATMRRGEHCELLYIYVSYYGGAATRLSI